jgi:hypothetical protein
LKSCCHWQQHVHYYYPALLAMLKSVLQLSIGPLAALRAMLDNNKDFFQNLLHIQIGFNLQQHELQHCCSIASNTGE